MHDHEVDIDEALVRRLLQNQMPGVGSLRLSIVEPWGTDNAVWRLGDDLVVRLPRIDGAQGQVDKEARWLPKIAPHLSIAVPEPLAVGEPEFGYPYRWALHRWNWNSACLGDPAVDVQVVWSPLFTDESRRVFLEVLNVDDATIRRSKGAAVNQACAALPYYLHTYPLIVERSWHKLALLGIGPLAER